MLTDRLTKDGRCRSGRTVLTVLLLDLGSHLLERFAFIHHFHHVTRDPYADASSQAHAIEFQFVGSRAVLDVARCVTGVALGAAAAVAGNVTKNLPIGDREAIRLADFIGSTPDVLWQGTFWS